MSVIVEEPPPAIVSVAEAKSYLRVESDEDDALIEALIAAAQGGIDGYPGDLRRSLGPQTIRIVGEVAPDEAGQLRLSYGPVLGLLSIVDVDAGPFDLTSCTWDEEGLVTLARGASWPWTRWDGVTVRYRAGYAFTAASDAEPGRWTGPAPIRVAIKQLVADLYQNRSAKVADRLVANPTVDRMLARYRLYTR